MIHPSDRQTYGRAIISQNHSRSAWPQARMGPHTFWSWASIPGNWSDNFSCIFNRSLTARGLGQSTGCWQLDDRRVVIVVRVVLDPLDSSPSTLASWTTYRRYWFNGTKWSVCGSWTLLLSKFSIAIDTQHQSKLSFVRRCEIQVIVPLSSQSPADSGCSVRWDMSLRSWCRAKSATDNPFPRNNPVWVKKNVLWFPPLGKSNQHLNPT